MPVTIKFDKNTTTFKITNTFNSKLGMLASEVLNDCNQYCKEASITAKTPTRITASS